MSEIITPNLHIATEMGIIDMRIPGSLEADRLVDCGELALLRHIGVEVPDNKRQTISIALSCLGDLPKHSMRIAWSQVGVEMEIEDFQTPEGDVAISCNTRP